MPEASGQQGFTLIPDSTIKALDSAYAMGLGSGEVAVLSYAHQHSQVALIDDRRARRIAQQLDRPLCAAMRQRLRLRHQVPSPAFVLRWWPGTSMVIFRHPLCKKQLLAAAGELT